jgi:hypothetical protein
VRVALTAKSKLCAARAHASPPMALPCADILGINNLVGLDSLVKLKLDNNKIWKIQNLEHLVNLQWLGTCFFHERNM